MAGQNSWFHPADRVLALGNSLFSIVTAFWAISWWEVLLLIIATFTNYGFSVYFMKMRNFTGYEVAHTLWHITGGASLSYVTAHACGFSTSFSSTCEPRWVGTLYCNCLVPASSNVTLS